MDYRADAPKILRDFLIYHETIKGHSKNTVDEYFLDLRTFFRYLKISRGLVPRSAELEEISVKNDLALSAELQREIGKNMIALVYGYTPGGTDRFDAKCAALEEHEVRFYLCPGTQNWKRKLPAAERLTTAKANIDEAFAAARRHGAEGVMLCDWGDDGFTQPLEESRPMMEYAAKLYRQEGGAGR